ncbi:aminotransferase class I/II-fold pyridoxal phosphate-dependent enzyme [Chryseobacterium paridis]|uniref:Aminotransferase class I/II-fold pyridoxal phosphate-dependent enzyme n=1 Tax=Chryseobacterium paridis TaxID=2800328 RepID=A0ABS1FVJ6_9FLAO|nr:aminotransferase class I/II-fold pyridoxal phosphate-dependent enzyme [Chryseobacterium paridis]MBK1896283.1 aminotransferase class I/II-fold pyridoxal phosphate-dependent enzyme [Chryseobacterium paridis]
MGIDFTTATFKDFENIPDYDIAQRAEYFYEFLDHMKARGHMNYRLKNTSGTNATLNINIADQDKEYISFVSSDYLGFTQHPKVKEAAIEGIEKYGTGTGASPLIGGYFDYHNILEKRISQFFGRNEDEVVLFTTGYAANSATLQILMQKEDIAILDMGVHASVHEGCAFTNKKTFPHNNLEALEHILKMSESMYRTKLVIIDGVYSQEGDTSHAKEIYDLVKKYNAYLMIDDAHGVGVLGKTGRGALEDDGLLDKVDFITGTSSKTFGNLGGYVIANKKIASFLKFQSRQHIFSVTAPPSSAGIVKAIDLVDEEPIWKEKLWDNINYLKKGLDDLGLDTGITNSAIIPVKIGDQSKMWDIGRILIENGVYTNPIMYPAVPRKDARIRMTVTARHEKEHLDKTLNVFDDINKKMHIAKK